MMRRRVVLALCAALALAACDGGDVDDDQAATDGGPETEVADSPREEEADDGGREGDDGDEDGAEPPASQMDTESMDAPTSSAEIRVGELIVEFDGEVLDEGTLLTLEEPILFDLDSAELKPEAAEALDNVAEVLEFYEDAPVEVIGHTDDQGTREYNLQLSSQRADAVGSGLTEQGILADRISTDGRAFDDPVASNDDEEGRAQNRRVEVLIVGVVPPDHEDGDEP